MDHLIFGADDGGQLIGIIGQEVSLVCCLICIETGLEHRNFCIFFSSSAT